MSRDPDKLAAQAIDVRICRLAALTGAVAAR